MKGGVILFALLGLAFMLGGALLIRPGYLAFSLHAQSASWTRVPAYVESVTVVAWQSQRSSTRTLAGAYTYTREGARRRSTRLAVEAISSGQELFLERRALLERHRESGAAMTALVDPEHPDEALLFRDDTWPSLAVPVVGTVFLASGLCFLSVAARGLARRRSAPRGKLVGHGP